jgi:predicted transposase/invertase (TIGR01784 family)
MKSLELSNEEIEQAYEEYVRSLNEPDIQTLAVARHKFLWDQEIREREAREEGIEIAREKARQEAIERGIEIGRQEALLQTAKGMLAAGIPIETICKITGLSPENFT